MLRAISGLAFAAILPSAEFADAVPVTKQLRALARVMRSVVRSPVGWRECVVRGLQRFVEGVLGVRGGKAMGNARSFQERPTDHGAVLSRAASRVKGILLAFALAVGAASTATAAPLTINTDSSWLATNALPAPTWLFDPSFDTTAWINASVSTVTPAPCLNGADCIWYDGQNSATQFVWLRKTFTISDTVLTAVLVGGIDDDGDIFVNGIPVYSDHDGTAGSFGPVDVAAFLHPGVNVIAVAAEDNFVFGHNHLFVAQLQVQTSVPEPASLLVLASSLSGLAVLRWRKRQN